MTKQSTEWISSHRLSNDQSINQPKQQNNLINQSINQSNDLRYLAFLVNNWLNTNFFFRTNFNGTMILGDTDNRESPTVSSIVS